MQVPAQIFPTNTSSFVIRGLVPDYGHTLSTAQCSAPPTFRLICNDRARTSHVITEHSHGVIIFDLATPVQQWLLGHLDSNDVLNSREYRDLLIANVWANPERRLSAWQQVYLLACIRTSCRRHRKKWMRPRITTKKKLGVVAPQPKAMVFAICQDNDEQVMTRSRTNSSVAS